MTHPRKFGPFRLAVALSAFWVAGCGGTTSTTRQPERSTLMVAAASDLQTALPVLIAEFRKESPGVEVETTFGASGRLAEQIKGGAPYDLFLAANMKFVEGLADANAVDRGSIHPYAVGALVLAVHPESGKGVAALADLSKPEVKAVALANPETAPYGAAGKQALTRAGLWDAVQPKIAQADTVRQALQFVQTGNAEAGLVGKATTGGAEVRVVEIDPALYDPIVQGLGVVSASKQKKGAEAFASFVLGPKGQAVLASFGFRRAP